MIPSTVRAPIAPSNGISTSPPSKSDEMAGPCPPIDSRSRLAAECGIAALPPPKLHPKSPRRAFVFCSPLQTPNFSPSQILTNRHHDHLQGAFLPLLCADLTARLPRLPSWAPACPAHLEVFFRGPHLANAVFQDILTGDEIISDSYDVKEVDGVVYEADCSKITIGGESFGMLYLHNRPLHRERALTGRRHRCQRFR